MMYALRRVATAVPLRQGRRNVPSQSNRDSRAFHVFRRNTIVSSSNCKNGARRKFVEGRGQHTRYGLQVDDILNRAVHAPDWTPHQTRVYNPPLLKPALWRFAANRVNVRFRLPPRETPRRCRLLRHRKESQRGGGAGGWGPSQKPRRGAAILSTGRRYQAGRG